MLLFISLQIPLSTNVNGNFTDANGNGTLLAQVMFSPKPLGTRSTLHLEGHVQSEAIRRLLSCA
ncbi:unnamed protein product [Ilex paraguariensis]|uniref:Uncharacterized protein n=1 Tax=Ilex paraguariensis TaxID=185542 RepID=A0ABC8SBI3_9AQUA